MKLKASEINYSHFAKVGDLLTEAVSRLNSLNRETGGGLYNLRCYFNGEGISVSCSSDLPDGRTINRSVRVEVGEDLIRERNIQMSAPLKGDCQ